jgi:hypothetical protein
MKYNTPKEFWQLIKAFKAFKKQQQELAQLDQVVFDRFKAHLNEKQIQYSITHPDNMFRWQIGFDDERSGIMFYYQDGTDFILDAYCYQLQEPDKPIDYVRFSNVFNALINRGSLFYNSEGAVLRYKSFVSMREIFWEPEILEHRLYNHFAIANDISLCAQTMHQTGNDPFDVVADFMNSRTDKEA